MIKINNITKVLEKEGTREVEVPIYLDRSTITLMIRDENEGLTNVYLNHQGFSSIKAKETPEEILNLPELPEYIDWEKRRYEIAKEIAGGVYSRTDSNPNLLDKSGKIINRTVDLIEVFKWKGGKS